MAISGSGRCSGAQKEGGQLPPLGQAGRAGRVLMSSGFTCQLHQGLIAHGEHLTSRCQGWTEDQVRQKCWAPEGV
jgi:hypothetical protein